MKNTELDTAMYQRIHKEAIRQVQAGKDAFTFITGNANPQFSVPGSCEIRDPQTGSVFSIKYVRGLSTLFVDMMSEFERKVPAEQIIFQRGYRIVNANDTNLLVYLLICSYNEDSTYRFNQHAVLFKHFDIDKKAHEYNDKIEKIVEAQSSIKAMSPNEVMAISFAMTNGLQPVSNIIKQPISELRSSLYAKATNTPQLIIDAISNPIMKVKYWVSRAIIDGHVIEDKMTNKLTFKNGTLIAHSQSMPVFDYFCETCDKRPESIQVLKDIITLVDPNLKEDEKFDAKRGINKDLSLVNKIIKDAMEAGVIEETASGLFVSYFGSERRKKYANTDELEEDLITNTSLIAKIILAIDNKKPQ